MKVKLIPVIEIVNYGQDIKMPDHGPYWEHSDAWEDYRLLSNAKAGFSEKLKPYLKASPFYRISEISDEDLLIVIEKEIEKQQTDEQNGIEDVVCAFDGGYVLRLDHEDVYFPQCCGDLADLKEWENLTTGKTNLFYPGHPFPHVTESGDRI